MMKHIAIASLFLALIGWGPAMADDDDCHVPMSLWQPREAVQKMAEGRGWQVSRIKIDDGCYEIRGVDETGRRFKARLDPATLSVVKMKRKDRHDDDREGEDHHPWQAAFRLLPIPECRRAVVGHVGGQGQEQRPDQPLR